MASPEQSGRRNRTARRAGAIVGLLILLGLTGCGPRNEDTASGEDEAALTPVVLQLDWVPEAAHGGFYQATETGIYAREGLEVTILPGGSGTNPLQEVALGKADFSIARLDDVILGIERGLPLAVVASYHQHDPQGLMLHAEDPAKDFPDLDGRKVMLIPGSAMLLWLEHRFDMDLHVIPLDYGIQRFVMDKDLIQQCFVTSQPYFLDQQGVETRTLLLADSGFDPGRVIYCRSSLLNQDPERVAAFIRASIEGWKAYVFGERGAADARILELNASVSQDLNNFSVSQMRDLHILEGRPGLGLAPGTLPEKRIQDVITIMREIGLLESDLQPQDVVPYDRLPAFVGL
jgi:NitT/TauT family transport system substrate-binding protein